MTDGARRASLGPRTRSVAIACLLAAGTLTACSAEGGGAAGSAPTRPGSSTTTTAGGPTDPGSTAPDDPGDGPDPAVEDVPDTVFDGLGDPRIDVSHHDVTVRADPGVDGLAGRAELTLAARTAEPLDSFTLDLRGPTITSVTVDGEDAEVEVGDDQVAITPASPLEPGVDVVVAIEYEGEPANTEFPALGVPVGWQQDQSGGWFTMSEPDGTATWTPVNDHPSDKATWTITLDTPADATGVSNGRLVSSDEADGRRLWVWETDRPMASYLVLAAIGDYDLVTRDGPGDIEVTFAYPPGVGADDRAGFDRIDEIITFFSEAFGPYPDDDAGAIVVDASFGLALETQTRPLFGTDGLDASALAHEVAHQWFGDAVSPATWADLWLNESFATYADWLWIAEETGADLNELADSPYVYTGGDLSVTDPRAAGSFDGVIYQGGARALQALRLTIGDDAFFRVLRRWFAENGGANATTADFIALAEDESGRDLTAFFDAWLTQADQPELPT